MTYQPLPPRSGSEKSDRGEGRLVVGGWWNQVAGTNLDLEYIGIESTIFEATGFCWFLGVKKLLMENFSRNATWLFVFQAV